MNDLICLIAKLWVEKVHGGRYLSHERYVSGWGSHLRDDLHIAYEDGHGKHESRVDTLRAVISILTEKDQIK